MPNRHDLLFVAMQSFVDTVADRFDVADVLFGLTEHTVAVLDATTAGVSLADDDGAMRYVSAWSEAAAQLESTQEQTRQGPCHDAYTSGRVVSVNDIADHDEWATYRSTATRLGLHAVLGVPLTVGQRSIGALNVYNTDRRHWTTDDREAAMLLAKMASSYVSHASERHRVERVNEQLQQALISRVVIEQAKGLLAGELGIGLDAGFERMRRHARTHNKNLHAVADAVVNLGLRPAAPPPRR